MQNQIFTNLFLKLRNIILRRSNYKCIIYNLINNPQLIFLCSFQRYFKIENINIFYDDILQVISSKNHYRHIVRYDVDTSFQFVDFSTITITLLVINFSLPRGKTWRNLIFHRAEICSIISWLSRS